MERYAGPIRLVPSTEGVQTQGINPATGQWENLLRATEQNTMPGVRPGSDQFFESQVAGLPEFVPDTGTGQEPSNGGGLGGWLNDNATQLAVAAVTGGALGGFSSMMGGAPAAAGAGAGTGAGTAGGLDAIGQMVTQVPMGMTATPYANSLGFGSADAWLSSLGAGAGGAASAATAASTGGTSATEEAMLQAARNQQIGSLANGGITASTGLGLGGAASGASAFSKLLDGSAGLEDYLKIGAPLAGALLGSQDGSKQAGTTTTVQDVPDWQKPYVLDLFNKAQSTYNASQGQNASKQALVDAGSKQLTDTINGNYLSPDSNPYLKGMFNAGADQIANKVNSQFSSAGRYGSGGHTGELGYQLGNFGNNLYGNAYQTGRQQQLTAATAAPGYAASAATSPFAGLEAYGNIVGQRFGSQTQSPYFSNQVGGALSGALAGYGLSKAFG